MKSTGSKALALLLVACSSCASAPEPQQAFADEETESPRSYVCYRAHDPLLIDGKIDEISWRDAAWTEDFVDIQGDGHPLPRHRTRAKMLWDADYFYVAAELEEPHVWATLTRRDSVIYHDNDFEVFIDPDGDTHEYYELEINAHGTVWDLMLIRPYRDGGPAIDAWDIAGLKSGIDIQGSLNQPDDVDQSWTVELAFPWSVLKQAAHKDAPPRPGDCWRVNFSRVQWHESVSDGHYLKTKAEDGSPLPEDNWVWSPQGAIAMHRPEMWGHVQFADMTVGKGRWDFVSDPRDRLKQVLRRVYYAQREHHAENGTYAADLESLGLDGLNPAPRLSVSPNSFEAWLEEPDGERIVIDREGRVR